MEACAEQMNAAAIEAQKIVRKYFVVELDFSVSSLPELEGLLAEVEYAFPGGRSKVNLELLGRTWGAYLGEVLRRNAGGEWQWDREGEAPRPALQTDQHRLFPLEFVRQRLAGKTEQSFADFYAEHQEKLQA